MRRASAIIGGLLVTGGLVASDWTRFRGSNGTGVAEGGELPVDFGPATGVSWQADVPTGKSSPILTASRVYLTAHDRGELLTLAIERSTGTVLWRRKAPARRLEKMHRLDDEASPTPVTVGTNVYSFFGGFGLVAYGPSGNELWTLPLDPFTNFHGMGASPILVDGKVYMVSDAGKVAVVAAGKDWKVL